uniref:Ig-like domain-containing protein n=1 Tax=Sinocyclocheilus grahami TaxID=75366 RepID=A0A672N371_SINGR
MFCCLFCIVGSCAAPDVEVHKAVGDSLELIADYPKKDLEVQWKYNQIEFAEYQNDNLKKVKSELFNDRLKMNKDTISVTVTDLKLQDSGRFSIVAVKKSEQYDTKEFVLHVHELIREVKIEYNYFWLQSKNICRFHLRCLASGDPNPSYSWIRHQTQGSHLNISLRLAEKATLNCTASNTVSVKYATETVVCTEKSDNSTMASGIYLLIAVGVGIVAVIILSGTVAVCCRWRKNKGVLNKCECAQTKRSDSVVNGMSIYETVDDIKLSQNLVSIACIHHKYIHYCCHAFVCL